MPTRAQQTVHFLDERFRLPDVLQHLGKKQRIESTGRQIDGPVEVDLQIHMRVAVQCIRPIHTNRFSDQVLVHAIERDLAAAQIQQPALCERGQLPLVRAGRQIGDHPRRYAQLDRVTRTAQYTMVIHELAR